MVGTADAEEARMARHPQLAELDRRVKMEARGAHQAQTLRTVVVAAAATRKSVLRATTGQAKAVTGPHISAQPMQAAAAAASMPQAARVAVQGVRVVAVQAVKAAHHRLLEPQARTDLAVEVEEVVRAQLARDLRAARAARESWSLPCQQVPESC